MDELTARAHAEEIFRDRLASLLDAGYMLRREEDPREEIKVAAGRGTESPVHLRLRNNRDKCRTIELDGGFSRYKQTFSFFEVTLDGEVLADVFYKSGPAAE